MTLWDKTYKRLLCFVIGTLSGVSGSVSFGQQVLTLDNCIELALYNNNSLKISRTRKEVAYYDRKAAFTEYLPKLSFSGAFFWNSESLSLLSNSQQKSLSNLGWIVTSNLKTLSNETSLITNLQQILNGIDFAPALNDFGQKIRKRFHTDTRRIWLGGLTITQPLFTGGKIDAYNQIMRLSEQLAEQECRLKHQNISNETEEIYWQIVSLSEKEALAIEYFHLIDTLHSDVCKLIESGMATQAEGLSVKVKMNEAEMQLMEIANGLSLSRMLLCRLCGLPLDTPLRLADEDTLLIKDIKQESYDTDYLSIALLQRPELQSLKLAEQIRKQQIRIARADFLPTLGITGNYLFSNPSLLNGFEQRFKGLFSIGLVLKVPLFNWNEGRYKINSAKASRQIAEFELKDAREKIMLQVNQCSFRMKEAYKKLNVAHSILKSAMENLRYANLSFDEGLIPASGVMEAQTVWQAAHTSTIEAYIDVKIAESNFKKALGNE